MSSKNNTIITRTQRTTAKNAGWNVQPEVDKTIIDAKGRPIQTGYSVARNKASDIELRVSNEVMMDCIITPAKTDEEIDRIMDKASEGMLPSAKDIKFMQHNATYAQRIKLSNLVEENL